MNIGKDFITRFSFSQELKPTIVNRDFIKLKTKQNKTFCIAEETSNGQKGSPQNGKVSSCKVDRRWLIPRIYK